MKEEFTLAKVQELSFGILQFIKRICDENQIRYYLAYGTLIGAVRHKGFIPWDDDVDIMMPRKDYKKLLAILNSKPHPYYKLISADTDERFQVPLPKVVDTRTVLIQDYDIVETVPLGVYVDIFLMDGAGNDYQAAVNHYDEAFKLYRYWKKSRLKLFPSSMPKLKGLLRWLKNLPFKVMGSRYFMKRLIIVFTILIEVLILLPMKLGLLMLRSVCLDMMNLVLVTILSLMGNYFRFLKIMIKF